MLPDSTLEDDSAVSVDGHGRVRRMNIVAELTVAALRTYGGDAWPHYGQALISACKKSPPPFGTRAYGEIYRDAAADPYWLAVSLMTNAEREGEGAGHLWDLAACTAD